MAGSLEHLATDGGWSLIENMGDAAEATEELLWLVLSVIGEKHAQQLIDTQFYPMKNGTKPKSPALLEVERRMEQ